MRAVPWMDSALLQNWVTIAGSTSLTSIGQGSDMWFELEDIEDVGFVLEVKEVTGTVTMNYETAVAAEEGSFQAMVVPFTISTGVRVDTVLASYAAVAPATYVRWRLTNPGGAGSWDAHFRIWLVTCSLAP